MRPAEAVYIGLLAKTKKGSMVCFGHQSHWLAEANRAFGNRHNPVLVNSKEVNY
jgi:hypothetical protein